MARSYDSDDGEGETRQWAPKQGSATSNNKKNGGGGGRNNRPSGANDKPSSTTSIKVSSSAENKNHTKINVSTNSSQEEGDNYSNGFKSRTTATTRAFLTDKRFADLPEEQVSEESQLAMKDMGFEFMTKVQAESLPPILSGKDVFAKAKTGTGKTIGFLLPTLEKAWRIKDSRLVPTTKKMTITSLVLSPTRELASQIHEEALALTKYWPSGDSDSDGFSSLLFYGGVDIKRDQRALNAVGNKSSGSRTVDLLVVTPGRIYDHLQKNTAGICESFFTAKNDKEDLFTLILDEADQLLELGFRDAICKIVEYLPQKQKRQSLLFSATLSKQVENVLKLVLKNDDPSKFEFVDTSKNDAPPAAITQSLVVCPRFDILETFYAMLLEIILFSNSKSCSQENQKEPKKVICFFCTARQTQFFAELGNALFASLRKQAASKGNKGKGKDAVLKKKLSTEIFEIHSRKSQATRTKTSDKFREAEEGILFSSDVSARGLDYPGVTHVIQVGTPASKEQYTHRLGRTARAGESGEGILLLCDFEAHVMGADFERGLSKKKQVLKELPEDGDSNKEGLSSSKNADVLDTLCNSSSKTSTTGGPSLEDIARSLRTTDTFGELLDESDSKSAIDDKTKDQCYVAWLGYYNGLCPKRIPWSKAELVEQANLYADYVLFCSEQPSLMKKTVGMMGLKGVPGLKIEGAEKMKSGGGKNSGERGKNSGGGKKGGSGKGESKGGRGSKGESSSKGASSKGGKGKGKGGKNGEDRSFAPESRTSDNYGPASSSGRGSKGGDSKNGKGGGKGNNNANYKGKGKNKDSK
ncbi:unnamed protein product [Amoebophrya sp. A25]|nr:unnamed protein product [Amoebophrya sp. A25]|eukprot:GSA25T00001371001.1